jgi:hypothetical protein
MSNLSFNGERRTNRRAHSHTGVAPCDSKDCSMSPNCAHHKDVKVGGLDYKAAFKLSNLDQICVGFKAKAVAA